MADVFVFGSNLAGRHGAGSAKWAVRHHGAVYGIGNGRCDRSYAIPTKDERLKVLPLNRIQYYVTQFLNHARSHKKDSFHIVAIGCGLAGYSPHDIAPFFKDAPYNCKLPPEFEGVLIGD